MHFYSLLHQHPNTVITDQPTDTFRAGVAIVLREDDHICMIRRATKNTDYWSGHMGFPGGREESRDSNLLQTAIRETQEEISLNLHPHQYQLRLPDMKHSHLQVSGFVFALPSTVEYELIPDPKEVAKIHWLSLHDFLKPDLRSTRVADYKGQTWNMPVVHIGEADVWGISLYFIEHLLRILQGKEQIL